MAEYIDREALIDAMQAYQYDAGKDGFGIMALIGTQPAADVAPVVRCKDCECNIYGVCQYHGATVLPEWFCWHGKRKDVSE